MLTNTQIARKRKMLSQKIRQAQIEVAVESSLPNARIAPASEIGSLLNSFHDALVWLKDRRSDLKDRFSIIFRTFWSGANLEASAWRAFRAEYGPDDPLTRAIDFDVKSVQRQRLVDHYQRRV